MATPYPGSPRYLDSSRLAQAQNYHDLNPTSQAGFASFDGVYGATTTLLAKPKLNWLKIATSCDTCLTDVAAGCGSAFSCNPE